MKCEYTAVEGMILAGGKGTRMGMEDQKCLLPIDGRPVLGHVLDAYSQAFGSANVTICVAYRADDVVKFVNKNTPRNIDIRFSIDSGHGRLGDIYRSLGERLQRPALVTEGDVYINPSIYSETFSRLFSDPGLASTALSPYLNEVDTHAIGKIEGQRVVLRRPIKTPELSG